MHLFHQQLRKIHAALPGFMLFFCLTVLPCALTWGQSVRPFVRFVPMAPGTGLFSEHMEAADVNADGFKDIFFGAPGSTRNGQANAGVIFLITGPFQEGANLTLQRDTLVTQNSQIIGGRTTNAFIGREFRIGNFNGDANPDIAVTQFGFSGTTNAVLLFFGPFQQGAVRETPDLIIQSDRLFDGFGQAMTVLENLDGLRRDGLAIGANGRGPDEEGEVLVFRNLASATGVILPDQATTVFRGPESEGLFGSALAFLGDVNGDGNADLGISAPTTSIASGGFKRGSVYVFFGPLRTGTVFASQANVVFHGRNNNNSWGSRIWAYRDINNDGLADFAFSSTIEGAVALARGRRTWSTSIRIGDTPTVASDSLILFRIYGNMIGFGSAAEFTGDFNRDGIRDPIIGARGDETPRAGSFSFFLMNGTPRNPPFFGVNHLFASEVINLGNVSANDLYNVDDVIFSSPRDINNLGYAYLYRGEINPPALTFNVSPSNALEIGQTVNLNIEWSKGSRDIRQVRLVRTLNNKNDTTRFTLGGENRAMVQQTFATNATVQYRVEVIDDLGITVPQTRVVNWAAFPRPFELVTDFTQPLVVEGDRNRTQLFSWTASADTNRRPILYQLMIGPTIASLDLANPATQRVFLNQTGGLSVGAFFGDIRNYLAAQGATVGSTTTAYWQVYANNGVLLTSASNGPRRIDLTLRPLDNNLLLTTPSRGMTILGNKENFITFQWQALQADQSDLLIRYQFVVLQQGNNGSRVLFSRFTNNNGASREFNFTFEDADRMLVENNLKQQAISDSARVFFTVRAVINESSEWYANNGPRRLGIKFLRIFNNTETEERSTLPVKLTLKPAFPNPFNPQVTVPFGLPEATRVTIEIVNILGQQVYRWESPGALPAGWQQHRLESHNWASGVYIVRVRTAKEVAIQKVMLVK